MKTTISYLQTRIDTLLRNAVVFHSEGRTDDRDRAFDDVCELTEAIRRLEPTPTSVHEEEETLIGSCESQGEIVRALTAWIGTAAQNQRNADFYRGIVTQIGEMFGDEAKRSDDGSLSDSVLALKVPGLVAGLRATLNTERELRIAAETNLQNLAWIIRGEVAPVAISGLAVEIRDAFRLLNEKSRTDDTQFRLLARHFGVTGRTNTEIVSEVAERWTRRLSADQGQAPPSADTGFYRILEVGEIVREGDEFLDHEEWVSAVFRGIVNRALVGYYRRPISLDTQPPSSETPPV